MFAVDKLLLTITEIYKNFKFLITMDLPDNDDILTLQKFN